MSGSLEHLSFEFFPPRSAAGKDRLLNDIAPKFSAFSPEFMSVTYGAGGTTRDSTFGVVKRLRESGVDAAPHLSVGGDDEETIARLLEEYKAIGVNRLVALRGDVPSGMGGFNVIYANELVAFIRERTGNHFHIEVAAYPEIHPQAESYDKDIYYLKGKFDAGADSAITQYFYNVESYFYFLDRCAAMGIDKPIYAGIMPITNFQNLARFSRNCGAEIPRWICQRIEGFGDDQQSIRDFGVEVVTQLCQTLIDSGAPGLHFYSMNQADPTVQILNNLGR
ncbi:MAG: methylenetetrahydrofolate reductase [NAD(P)H] [Gammaproteobacteria bacterium]|nr:MAG: methylenetetrahydrofolate reductase [NAD(P)H] [Gammaproteobacteria bacterium]